MAMGKRKKTRQMEFWINAAELPQAAQHPFYEKVNELLGKHGFDAFVENLCAKFYAPKMGRPSIPPPVYFRMLLIGYFEGIDSERGMAWRAGDSMALRAFLGYELNEVTPDHSSVSRTRRAMDLETHHAVFTWVLQVLAKEKLLRGKTLGIDATTLEANAALRSIVRRDTDEQYRQFLERLAKESGIETPTREQLANFDRKRDKKMSNDEWKHPHDDASIGKMKDGRTHMLHKSEHAVDLDTQAIVAVTLSSGAEGDTTTGPQTLQQAVQNMEKVVEDPRAAERVHEDPCSEVVEDKGYHSNQSLADLEEAKVRSYVSEPDRGRRQWADKEQEQHAVYGNRRRIRGVRGRRLRKRRAEYVERSFAHCYDTGGMRRTHLRWTENILKRLLIHVSGFNLGLVMRKLFGRGTPRGLVDRLAALFAVSFCLFAHWRWSNHSLPDGKMASCDPIDFPCCQAA